MRMIAKDGPAALYGGALGKKIVDHLDDIVRPGDRSPAN